MKKLSIVLPAYNAESTIIKAVDSLINQAPHNIKLDIIIVDDCSTDNTFDIIVNKYGNFKNITIIQNVKNMGLSVSRNIGVERSNADYIGFLDSDDHYNSNFLTNIEKELENGYDIIAFGVNKVNKGKVIYEIDNLVVGEFDVYDYLKRNVLGYAYNKLYKSEFIKKYKFKKGLFYEDYYFINDISNNLIMSNKNINGFSVKEIYYNYVFNANSITNSPNNLEKKILDRIFCLDFVIEKELYKITNRTFLEMLHYLYRDASKLNNEDLLAKINSQFEIIEDNKKVIEFYKKQNVYNINHLKERLRIYNTLNNPESFRKPKIMVISHDNEYEIANAIKNNKNIFLVAINDTLSLDLYEKFQEFVIINLKTNDHYNNENRIEYAGVITDIEHLDEAMCIELYYNHIKKLLLV